MCDACLHKNTHTHFLTQITLISSGSVVFSGRIVIVTVFMHLTIYKVLCLVSFLSYAVTASNDNEHIAMGKAQSNHFVSHIKMKTNKKKIFKTSKRMNLSIEYFISTVKSFLRLQSVAFVFLGRTKRDIISFFYSGFNNCNRSILLTESRILFLIDRCLADIFLRWRRRRQWRWCSFCLCHRQKTNGAFLYEPLHTFAIWIEHPATNELEILFIADCKRQRFFDECFMLFSCNRMSIWIASGFGFFFSHFASFIRAHTHIHRHTLGFSLLPKEYMPCAIPFPVFN